MRPQWVCKTGCSTEPGSRAACRPWYLSLHWEGYSRFPLRVRQVEILVGFMETSAGNSFPTSPSKSEPCIHCTILNNNYDTTLVITTTCQKLNFMTKRALSASMLEFEQACFRCKLCMYVYILYMKLCEIKLCETLYEHLYGCMYFVYEVV